MGKLYIANCSKQNQEVHYRLDLSFDGTKPAASETQFRPATRQTILPGRQEPIGGRDLPTTQIESIVRQLTPHGLVAVTDIHSPEFRNHKMPLVFSIDKPVAPDVIRFVMDSNSGVLTEEGRTRRIKAAIATNETIVQAVNQTLAQNQIDADINTKVDVEFEQVEQSEFEEKKIAEGVHVREDGPDAPPPPTAKERRAQRRKAA